MAVSVGSYNELGLGAKARSSLYSCSDFQGWFVYDSHWGCSESSHQI